MKLKDIRRLRDLADMVKEQKLSELAALKAAERSIDAEIAAVHEARALQLAPRAIDGEVDPAMLNGAHLRWLDWGDRRIAAANMRKAALRAEEELRLADARRAFGRSDVLKRLADD